MNKVIAGIIVGAAGMWLATRAQLAELEAIAADRVDAATDAVPTLYDPLVFDAAYRDLLERETGR